MDPKDTPDCNFTYTGPTPEIGDLRVQRAKEDGQRVVFSFWDTSEQERALVAAGADLKLGIWNNEPIPPVSLDIVTPYCPRGCEIACDLVTDDRSGTQVFACPRCHETANGTGTLPSVPSS